MRRLASLGPWWVVAALLAGGVGLLAGGQIRLGGRLLGISLLGAAVVRSVAPEATARGLRVRSRWFDAAVLAALGAATWIGSEIVTLTPAP